MTTTSNEVFMETVILCRAIYLIRSPRSVDWILQSTYGQQARASYDVGCKTSPTCSSTDCQLKQEKTRMLKQETRTRTRTKNKQWNQQYNWSLKQETNIQEPSSRTNNLRKTEPNNIMFMRQETRTNNKNNNKTHNNPMKKQCKRHYLSCFSGSVTRSNDYNLWWCHVFTVGHRWLYCTLFVLVSVGADPITVLYCVSSRG